MTGRRMRLLLLSLVLSSMAYGSSGGGDRAAGNYFASRSPVMARSGVAATSHPLASQIAIDVLKDGGSAVDAAIAANIALGVMEPTGSGIGGDLFAIVWDPKTKRLHGLNASGRSPRGQSYTQLKEKLGDNAKIPFFGPLSVSVPGAVDGWDMLHKRFGNLDWEQLFQGAIRYAREGVPVTPAIAHSWDIYHRISGGDKDFVGDVSNYRKTFLIEGKPPVAGEIFRNPDLALTLQKIAQQGAEVFYKGELAQKMDAYMRVKGIPLTPQDFSDHHGDWVEPVSVNYRGYDVFELPPNGQGIAVLQMLNVLEDYDLSAIDHNSAEYLHLLVEAKKLAFADRAKFYVDPDFYDVPLAGLLSKDYAAKRRKLISETSAGESVGAGNPRLKKGDTVYLTVADKDGMMVSLIQSNFALIGSGMVPDGMGFMLQNRGALFSMDPDHANTYAAGKRPFHTIIPGFVMKDGQPFLSFGVMGADMQPQGHVQVLCNIIDFGMNVQEAGDAARFRHASETETGNVLPGSGELYLESSIDSAVVNELQKRGHNVRPFSGTFGGYQSILLDGPQGIYYGASDMRLDGQAIGY
ncbi:MAG: gamma-glutamyltranspeptidase/glutathione hydrolase [Halioglobus sp.]|jgi:gamma-glutamyltranspeptidase/glutathione hydrolase